METPQNPDGGAVARLEQPVASGSLQIRDMSDLARMSDVLAKSGYFKDARGAAQAAVKVLYGAEIGIGPVQAMMNVHIIDGKPAPGASLIAALVKRSNKYTYKVSRHAADGCAIEFFEIAGEGWLSLGVSEFTLDDAKKAGLAGRGPWKSYPKAMCFARAMTQGARMFCPDVFGGAVYDPEELGGEISRTDQTREDRRPSAAHQAPSPTVPQGRPAAHRQRETPDEAQIIEEVDRTTGEVTERPAGDNRERSKALEYFESTVSLAGLKGFGLGHVCRSLKVSRHTELATAMLHRVADELADPQVALDCNVKGFIHDALSAIERAPAAKRKAVLNKWLASAPDHFGEGTDALHTVVDALTRPAPYANGQPPKPAIDRTTPTT